MHVIESRPNSKREGGFLRDWTSRVPLKSVCETSQPPAHGINLLSQHAPQISSGTGDGDRRTQGQTTITAYGSEGDGPI